MALDLTNGWHRKDSSSASNIYYGYSTNPGSGDTDFTYSIRRVNTTAGVESSRWSNDGMLFISSWSGRTYSYAAPLTSLSLTWSTSSSPTNRVSLGWSAINGVNIYTVAIRDVDGKLIGINGGEFVAPFTKTYTVNLINQYSYSQELINDGTYSLTVSGLNLVGSTSSTITINF